MQSIPVLRTTAYQPVFEFVEAMGLSAESHFEAVGAPLRGYEEFDRLVPERPLWALLDRLRRHDGIEDVGFRLGASHCAVELPNVVPLLAGHQSLYRTVGAFCDALGSHNSAWNFWLEERPGGLRVCRRRSVFAVGAWAMEQYAVCYMVDVVRMAAPLDWWPPEVWLQWEGPLLPAERQWLGEARLHFGSPVTAIAIPRSLLARRPHFSYRQHPPVFGTGTISQGLAVTYREILQTRLLERRTRLIHVARQLGVQPRTLQRALARRGTSHRTLLEEARREAVCARLEDTDESIAEIARDLGFRHYQALSQSFKRWTGVSPSTYRRANRRRSS